MPHSIPDGGERPRPSSAPRPRATAWSRSQYCPLGSRPSMNCPYMLPVEIPVQADVGGGGVRVAPDPLQRTREEQSLSAGGEEKRVDRLHQEPHAKRLVAAIAQPHIHADGIAAGGRLQGLGKIAKNHEPCCVDAGGCFGDPQLHGGELGHAAVAAGDRPERGAHLGHVEEMRECALCHAQHRRHDGDRQHGEERLPIDRVAIVAHARRGGVGKLGKGEHAMGGNEHVPGDDGLAAGAGEPHRVPVVVDRAVGGRQQEESRLRRRSRLRNHAADELPLRIVAAAAEATGSR